MDTQADLERTVSQAATDPGSLGDAQWIALLLATGDGLDLLTGAADEVRRAAVGETITQVVNRNVSSSAYRAEPSGEPGTYGPDELDAIAVDAWDLGATEICVQGLVAAGESPLAYLEIARRIRKAAPGIHLHAFRPADVADLADRGGLGLDAALVQLREAGVDTVPGTGVKILSERVRQLIAPTDLGIERWIEVIAAAHRSGFGSTSVLFYGHVETAAERVAHLRELIRIQSGTGGFAEFVPIAMPGHGVPLVPGRSALDEHRAMFAVARLMLAGHIAHIQVPWTRLGIAATEVLLRSGADDLGGTLLDGRVRPDAGVEHGLQLPQPQARAIAARLGRPFRQRATDYGEPTEQNRP